MVREWSLDASFACPFDGKIVGVEGGSAAGFLTYEQTLVVGESASAAVDELETARDEGENEWVEEGDVLELAVRADRVVDVPQVEDERDGREQGDGELETSERFGLVHEQVSFCHE